MLPGMSEQERPPTEEELRAAYEAELKKVRVDDLLIQTILSLISLGGRRAGLAPGTEDERDPDQVRQAIEGVRALLPLAESALGPDAAKIRDALSQLQLAYSRMAGAPSAPGEKPPEPPPGTPEGGGSAQSSGRLWVPGQ